FGGLDAADASGDDAFGGLDAADASADDAFGSLGSDEDFGFTNDDSAEFGADGDLPGFDESTFGDIDGDDAFASGLGDMADDAFEMPGADDTSSPATTK
ncbi:MAG: hypothetical protein Q4A76_08540, partial [Porphyromonadaceae bacterium]|nr:hypothetical protein [Porphyromonadaceae bacterium]